MGLGPVWLTDVLHRGYAHSRGIAGGMKSGIVGGTVGRVSNEEVPKGGAKVRDQLISGVVSLLAQQPGASGTARLPGACKLRPRALRPAITRMHPPAAPRSCIARPAETSAHAVWVPGQGMSSGAWWVLLWYRPGSSATRVTWFRGLPRPSMR